MSYKKIEKGSVIGYDLFFVVVEAIIENNDLFISCICDNANNIYSFKIDNILKTDQPHKWIVLSPKKAVEVESWGGLMSLDEEDQVIFEKISRPIPLDVIAEVLAGKHDDRFEK